MIEIRYKGHVFKGKGEELLLLKPTTPPDLYEVWDPISEALAWDTLTFGVTSYALGEQGVFTSLMEEYTTDSDEQYVVDSGDLMDYTRGDPVQVYKDGAFFREFYLDSIQQRDGGIFEFSCISAVGLLAERFHRGGVYFGSTVGEIIAEVMSGIEYEIATDVEGLALYGWLPYDTARANLSKILFATGASLMKTAGGAPYIRFNMPDAASNVDGRTYYEQTVQPVGKYGNIELVEHTFYNSTGQAEVILFDNTNDVAASGSLIVFKAPVAAIRVQGLTVTEWGANWAVVSGTGILYGTPYVHIQRLLTASTGLSSGEVKSVADNALVSRLNSGNVLQRLVTYYGGAEIYTIAIKQEGERAGSLITFPTLSGSQERGYIKASDARASSFIRADLEVVTNWAPKGLGNQYSEYFIITADSSGTITIPAEHVGKRSLVVLFGGAEGGQGGYDGETGGRSYSPDTDALSWWDGPIYGGLGGEGGQGGAPGGCGKFLQFEIESLAASYSGHIGAGGAGGSHGGEQGSLGEDTELDVWSTEAGYIPEGPYVNLIDGTIYGEPGTPGTAGKAGGRSGDFRSYRFEDYDDGQPGESYNTIWRGGVGRAKMTVNASGWWAYASGSGGGGAARGNSGGAAYTNANGRWSEAGAGANATAPAQASFYRGGDGGHGGGGGGAGGYEVYRQGNFNTWHFSDGGAGGQGSAGGQGAKGFILFYV